MQYRHELLLLAQHGRTHPRPPPLQPEPRWVPRLHALRGRLRRRPDPRLDVQQYLALEFAVEEWR